MNETEGEDQIAGKEEEGERRKRRRRTKVREDKRAPGCH